MYIEHLLKLLRCWPNQQKFSNANLCSVVGCPEAFRRSELQSKWNAMRLNDTKQRQRSTQSVVVQKKLCQRSSDKDADTNAKYCDASRKATMFVESLLNNDTACQQHQWLTNPCKITVRHKVSRFTNNTTYCCCNSHISGQILVKMPSWFFLLYFYRASA